jgi:uncharacterized protein (DUF433 family)
MKARATGKPKRLELGEHIVADPLICHGKPTFKGTRIMVWQILDELAHGMSPAQIVKAWGGKITLGAIAESVSLARRSLLDRHGCLRHPNDLRAAA